MASTSISEVKIWGEINASEVRMSLRQRRFWEAIRIVPEKWMQHPYGDKWGGFWAVGIIGRTVIWYNDIEDGFNRSSHRRYGVIEEFFCNRDELEDTVQALIDIVDTGYDIGGQAGPPIPGEFRG